MRQIHRVGEKLFVDYCGPTMPVVNPKTGEIRTAQIFVAVLGASSYTYAEATWSQKQPDWIGSHVRAFSFYGGITQIVVPDADHYFHERGEQLTEVVGDWLETLK